METSPPPLLLQLVPPLTITIKINNDGIPTIKTKANKIAEGNDIFYSPFFKACNLSNESLSLISLLRAKIRLFRIGCCFFIKGCQLFATKIANCAVAVVRAVLIAPELVPCAVVAVDLAVFNADIAAFIAFVAVELLQIGRVFVN